MSAEAAEYRQASQIRLNGDINDCESYFFLLDDPEAFQKQYQILAMADGSCPDDTDVSASDKIFAWNTSKALSSIDLGTYHTTLLGQETTGSNQEILSSLYLGRRCFYDSRETRYAAECAVLWNRLRGDE